MIQLAFCDDDQTVLDQLSALLEKYRTQRCIQIQCTAFRSPLDLLAAMTRRALWPLVSVLTAYLCCQLRRWAALLVIALFPAGGTVLQDATELIVTLPILLVLIRWIAPSVRALSRSPLLLQLQFGMIPLLSYLFDYFTRIYTDLLSSGNQAAVEFMPFVCSLAYLGFVLHTTQEQQLRHCGAIRRHIQLCPAAGSVCAAHFPVKGRFNAFCGRFMPNTLLPHILCYSKLRRLYCRPILLL